MGEVFIANSRDLVDALVLDGPLDAGRAVVEDDNARESGCKQANRA